MKNKLLICGCCGEKCYKLIKFDNFETCVPCFGDLTVIDVRLNHFINTGKFSATSQNPADPINFSSDYLNFDDFNGDGEGDWQNTEDHN